MKSNKHDLTAHDVVQFYVLKLGHLFLELKTWSVAHEDCLWGGVKESESEKKRTMRSRTRQVDVKP